MRNTWELTEYQKEIDLYLQSAVRLYGHIPPRQFLQIFNRFHKENKLYKADLEKWMNKLNRQAKTYRIYTNAIINTTVSNEEIDIIIGHQQGKSFFIPKSEESFIQWSSPYYFPETEQSKKLKDYFLTVCKVPLVVIQPLIHELTVSIMEEQRMQCKYDILEKYHVLRAITVNQADELFSLFADFINNTPHWANCGYSPKEMRDMLI